MSLLSIAQRRPRRAEYLLLLAAISLMASLVGIGEAWLRLMRSEVPEGPLGPLHRYSEVYGWEPRKGYGMLDKGIRTSINGRGYRGPELAAKAGSRLRVVLLGDSIAFGLDVDDDATFAAILGSRPEAVEVANLAVQGYDLGQELIKLEREGLRLQPDVVVVALCLSNDFADVALPVFLYDGRHPKPYFTLKGDELEEHSEQLRLSWRQRVGFVLSEHSRIYGLLARILSKEVPAERSEHWQARARRALRKRRRVIALATALLARMSEDCWRERVPLIVAAFPDKTAYAKGSDLLHEVVSSSSLRAVTFVDMGERFRERGLAFEDIALDGIGHLNERGHQEAANILREVLVERGLLPDKAHPTAKQRRSHGPAAMGSSTPGRPIASGVEAQ